MTHLAVALLFLAFLAAPLAADAQPTRIKMPHVGVLSLGPVPADLRKALRDQGYVEGRTVLLESRPAANPGWFPDLAARLVDLGVDVILATSTPAAHAARAATRSIPIVVTLPGDPVAEGLVASLARPGGNVTGVSGYVAELNGKLLELLEEAVPSARRVGALTLPGTPARDVADLELAAGALGIGLQRIVVPAMEELETALKTAAQSGVGALVVLPAVPFALQEARLARLCLKHRLPAIFWRHSFAAAGGLLAYGPSHDEMMARAAALVVRILKGARPADLPVERVSRLDFVINLKTAKALGLTIPESVRLRATDVIE
jgi:putative ABC transport system substrate-binding protein